MANDKPITLDQLRARANDSARAILDRIWDYYCEKRAGMPAMELWPKFGGKPAVREALKPLGQSVVRLDWENGKECYRVPLLGVLVSNRGLEAEGLLLRYLEYVRERYSKGQVGPVTSEQLEKERGFSFEQSRFLSKLLNGSVFSGAASIPNNIAEPWYVEMPTVIADAPPDGDLRGFFQSHAMAIFHPNLPVDAREQILETMFGEEDDSQQAAPVRPRALAFYKTVGEGMTLETTFGRYTIGQIIGEGGAGRVFEAVDESGETYAIKLLDPLKAKGDKRRRFKNEIQFGIRNAHKNIILIKDYGLYGESPFYVMPLYKSTLRKLMSVDIPSQKALQYFTQLLDGVQAAHLLEVNHRDLKPENVLYDPATDCLVVADFGIAQFNQEELYTLVETGAADRLANFQYAAPEQRHRGQPIDHRADIYALGLMLNELFTHEIPLGSGHKTIAAVAAECAYLDELVEKMRQQDPNARSSSIGQVKNELIARGHDFVIQQRLSSLKKTVVPEREIDDPLINDPIQLVEVDYDTDGQLILVLSQPVNDEWSEALRNFGGHRAVMGASPRDFSLRGNKAIVPARAVDAQQIVDYFKEWLPRVNQRYKEKVALQKMKKEQEARRKLQAEIAQEEQRQQIRRNIKI